MITPNFPEAFVISLFAEALYGFVFNILVAWAHKNNFWHVSVSVGLGVTGTLVIAGLFMYPFELPFWKNILVLLACFVCSGVPMATGSLRRDAEKESHKCHAWPTRANKARETAVMLISEAVHGIAEDAKNATLAKTLPSYLNKLHEAIGALRSV